ncbi:MAG TPA: phosphoenolpyruvate--protein phosphotransferase [Bacteroidota bacterium]|nr:phosphoenolpyruvate--protein phosphotransferase [Bacteroidota bacterium]
MKSLEHIAARERVLTGIPASPGIAFGPAYIFTKAIPRVEERELEPQEIEPEVERLRRAVEKSAKELNKILLFAQKKVGDAKAKIFEAQIMVLQDRILLDTVVDRIRSELRNAEFIISDEIGKYAHLMRAARDEYMHERAHDMEDLKNRVIRNLQQEKLVSRLEGTFIVVSHALTPADTMILSRNHVLGYATDLGGVTSHAALFARSLKIPAVVGLGAISREAETGDPMIIDGYSGTVIIHPTEKRRKEFERRRERLLKFEAALAPLRDLPATTTDGHTVELSANIELTEELDYCVVQGSQGVGLFRTESLLIGRDDFPSEEEQYLAYKKAADRIYPNRVLMRTFDIGGDKVAPEMAEEANPFLGWRGIRVSLDQPELFRDQLRAMLRASVRKNIGIMFPMVTTIDEVRRAKKFVLETKAALKSKHIRFDENIQIGVMIEVPAAALNARSIAAEVDFLSIGSNDLIQYLLAVDRGNALVARLYKTFEPSVLTTLKYVINAAHRERKWVGICGQMAGNPLAAPLLIGFGIDELSVVPAVLPEIKKIIRSLNYARVQQISREALNIRTAEEVEAHLRKFLKKEIPDIPLDGTQIS